MSARVTAFAPTALIARELAIDRIDFLKMNIEGSERFALVDMEER